MTTLCAVCLCRVTRGMAFRGEGAAGYTLDERDPTAAAM